MTELNNYTRMPLACVLILFYSVVQLNAKKHLRTSTYTTFRWIVGFGMLHLVSSVVTEYTANHRNEVPVWFNTFAHTIMLVSLTCATGCLLHYLVLFVERKAPKKLTFEKWDIFTVLGLCILGEILLPIEYVDSQFGAYVLGWKVYCTYFYIGFEILTSGYLFVRYNKILGQKQYYALFTSITIITLVAIIQVTFPFILLTDLAITLIIVGLMLGMDDTHVYFSPADALYDQQGCSEMLDELFATKNSFKIGVFAFAGSADDVSQAMLSVNKQLPTKNSGVICGVIGPRVMLVIPVKTRNKVALPQEMPQPQIGNIPVRFTYKEVECLPGFSMSDLYKRIMKFSELYEESVLQKDDLTNTLRRPSFIHQIENMISTDQEFAFLMLDLDNFKTINDTYGHQTGDKVLQTVVQALQKGMRSTDLVCRMGGDEFAIALPSITDEQVITNITNRIYQSLEKVETLTGEDIVVTFSMGACIRTSQRLHTFQEVYAEADNAMYKAKFAGKNAMVFSEGSHTTNTEN